MNQDNIYSKTLTYNDNNKNIEKQKRTKHKKDDDFQESISLVTPDNIDSKMLTSLGSEKMAKKENGSQDPIGFHHFSSLSSSSSS